MPATETETNPPPITNYGRSLTRPTSFNPFGNGTGVVPRRGWDAQTSYLIRQAIESPVAALTDWAGNAPLRLLEVLATAHPMAQMAFENDASLAFSPGDTHIVAVENESDKQVNEEGTAVLDALWEAPARAVGGLVGLQTLLYRWVQINGLPCVEAVPGPRGTGLQEIVDFSPYNVRYRDTASGRILEFRKPGGDGGWQELNPQTCFATAWHGSRDNPYGEPRVGAFLSEGLADTTEQNSLKDILRAIAWPHLAFEFPVNETAKYAEENPAVAKDDNGDPLTPLGYAMYIHKRFMDMMATMLADDIINMPAGAKANVLNAGEGIEGLEGVLAMRRLRVCQSLLQLPTLMGITEGGTLAYSSSNMRLYAKSLERIRDFINRILLRIANLHLRLLGIPLIARADVEPIDTRDVLADETGRETQIRNERELVLSGSQSPEDFSINLTGSGLVDKTRAAAYFAPPEPQAEQNAGGQGDSGEV